MLFFRIQSPVFYVIVVLILNCLFDTLIGNGLQEIWIQMTGHHNVLSLKSYNLTFYQDKQLHFSLWMNSSDCKNTGNTQVILVPPLDQDSLDYDAYYSIYITLNPDIIWVHLSYINRQSQDQSFQYSPTPAHCGEFTDFKISWSNNGKLAIFSRFNSTVLTLRNQSISFRDIIIVNLQQLQSTDYNTVWRIKHSGVFTGYNCAKDNTYGAMDLLTSTTRSEIMCAAMCGKTDDCLGMNFNDQTKQCELIRSGQLVVMEARQGWKFSTKCLNGKEMCLACL